MKAGAEKPASSPGWTAVERKIDRCRVCDGAVRFLRVPVGLKRHPSVPPPSPTRLLMISVAPPWRGAYFWDETKPDRVRDGVFRALRLALDLRLQDTADFVGAGLYLIPAVRCPSTVDGRDRLPHGAAIENCSMHLRSAIEVIRPERILTFGRVPLRGVAGAFDLELPRTVASCVGRTWTVSVGDREVPLAATYFPGNRRHGKWELIPRAIAALLRAGDGRCRYPR